MSITTDAHTNPPSALTTTITSLRSDAFLDPTILLIVLRQLLALSHGVTAHQAGEDFIRGILLSTTPSHSLDASGHIPLPSSLPMPADGHASSEVTCDRLYRPRRPHGNNYHAQSNHTAPSQTSQSNLTAPSQMFQSNLTSSLDHLALVSRRALAHIQPLVVELVGEINHRMGMRGVTSGYANVTEEDGEGSSSGANGIGGGVVGGLLGGVIFDDISSPTAEWSCSSPFSSTAAAAAAASMALSQQEGYVLECVWMSLHQDGSKAMETNARDLWISSASSSSSSSLSSAAASRWPGMYLCGYIKHTFTLNQITTLILFSSSLPPSLSSRSILQRTRCRYERNNRSSQC